MILKRVIRCNLTKAGRILRLLRFHAHDLNLNPSLTVYQHKGHRLRFSRSGEPKIEQAYSTHIVVVGKRNPFAENAGMEKSNKRSQASLEEPIGSSATRRHWMKFSPSRQISMLIVGEDRRSPQESSMIVSPDCSTTRNGIPRSLMILGKRLLGLAN